MKPRQLRVHDYLGHMLDAVIQIQTYTRGKSPEQFLEDRLLQDGVIRNIEVLGEASRRLLEEAPDSAARFSTIPFTAIYAMRNQLSHGYFTVDLDTVWNVIERDIPELRERLEEALAEIAKEPIP
jgi:uncharacterized protein with HEPN domain